MSDLGEPPAAPEWHDLTLVLSADSPHVPAFPPVRVRRAWSQPEHVANVTELSMWCHVGTHVDAPLHFIPNGRAAHELPITQLVGPGLAWSIPITDPGQPITRQVLEQQRPRPRPGDRVLLHTGWGARRGHDSYLDNPHLTLEAAQWLVDHRVALVAMDFATPDLPSPRRPPDFGFPVHHALLSNDVLIVEHLGDAATLAGRRLDVVVAPLPILDADGSPCRVLARQQTKDEDW